MNRRCLLLLGSLVAPVIVPADDIFELEPYPVNTILLEEGSFSFGQSINVYGEEVFLRYLPRSLGEVLQRTSGIMVQKTALGQDSPYIRGFTGFHTLLTIDGIRLNNSVFRSGPNQYWATVDHLAMERVQVLKGPYAVEFGSDAVGGVVRLFTRSQVAAADGPANRGRTYARVSSAESSITGRAEFSRVTSGDALFGGVTWKDFGDLESADPVGRQPGTGYTEQAGDLKWIHQLDGAKLTVAAQYLRQDDVPRTHATVDGISWKGTAVGSDRQRNLDQERSLAYVRYTRTRPVASFDAYELTFSWQRQDEMEHRIRSNGRIDHAGFEVDTLALQAIARSTTTGSLRLDYGAEWYRDLVDSSRIQINPASNTTQVQVQGPVADDSTYDLAGAFIKAHVSVRDDLMLTGGARYSYARAEAGRFQDPLTGAPDSFNGDWDDLSLSARVVYAPGDSMRLFAGVSEGFRAPNLSDLTRLDIARSGELEIPSTDIDPESFVTCELGGGVEQGPLLLNLALFHTDIRNMLVRTPTGRIITSGDDSLFEVTKLNSGNGHVRGIELSSSLQLTEAWLVSANFTWMEGELETYSDATSNPVLVRQPVSRIMPPTVNASVRYSPPDGSWSIEGLVRWAGRQDKLAASDIRDTQRIPPGGTPGYVVVDLMGQWRATDNLSLRAGIDNVLDADYRVHGSGINGPGRNLVASADWRF